MLCETLMAGLLLSEYEKDEVLLHIIHTNPNLSSAFNLSLKSILYCSLFYIAVYFILQSILYSRHTSNSSVVYYLVSNLVPLVHKECTPLVAFIVNFNVK